MKPYWIIQNNIDGIDTIPMIKEVMAQGMNVSSVEHNFGKHDYLCNEFFGNSGCIICYGDIDFVQQVQHNTSFIPGAWCNSYNMKCSTYYAHFGKYLINSDYRLMPIGDVPRMWQNLGRIQQIIPKYIFLRPDSGMKPFAGYVAEYDNKHELQSLIKSIGSETLVLISSKKFINREWRFVICGRRVVAGCQYLPVELPLYTNHAYELANIIASEEWQPDLCYTADIVESEGRIYLLEINSFSCAGFYMCNIGDIIKYASVVAEEEWNDYA